MERSQLEHVIRAAAGITGAEEFIIIGSQAILGQFPNAPNELLASVEADIFTLRNPEDADLIDGSIGEGSPFHRTFGYYAHGVGQETAALPVGWRDRLVLVRNENTGGGTGLCLEVYDLACSKLAAGREKDLSFVGALLRHGFVKSHDLEDRLGSMPLTQERRASCLALLERITKWMPGAS
jgi:hypothetical protein